MRPISFISLYRVIARIVPLKHRLNFLVQKYIYGEDELAIPYFNDFSIYIKPNPENRNTISDLIFDGAKYLPEFSLIGTIKKKLKNGFVYVDVGSNIGTTIWLFARSAAKVYAFEPMPHLYSIIKKSIAANQNENIELRNKALGDSPGSVIMLNNNNSSVVEQASNNTITSEVSTLDIELASTQRIDLIKIDVEGFELKVLRGAKSIIAKHKPILLVELHPQFMENYGDDFKTVLDFIEEAGYSISYYSFLDELRQHKIIRLANRWRRKQGKGIKSKNAFIADVALKPSLSSYHLYCEFSS